MAPFSFQEISRILFLFCSHVFTKARTSEISTACIISPSERPILSCNFSVKFLNKQGERQDLIKTEQEI